MTRQSCRVGFGGGRGGGVAATVAATTPHDGQHESADTTTTYWTRDISRLLGGGGPLYCWRMVVHNVGLCFGIVFAASGEDALFWLKHA
jgi:hypothetical protein